MTIIPYISNNSLHLDSRYQFNKLSEAAEWAFSEMFDVPNNCGIITFRFKIIDTCEDISFSFSKKDGKIVGQLGWVTIHSFSRTWGWEDNNVK